MIKESLRTGSSPLIYINNPVESKIPNAFLSEEEFKRVLTDRVLSQRKTILDKNSTATLKSKISTKRTYSKTRASLKKSTNHLLHKYREIYRKNTRTVANGRKEPTVAFKADVKSTPERKINQLNVKTPAILRSSNNTLVTNNKIKLSKIDDISTKSFSKSSQNSPDVTNKILLNTVSMNTTYVHTKTSHTSTSHYNISTGHSSTETNLLPNTTTYQTTKKEGPRRKTTLKLRSKSTSRSATTKRTTLGVSIEILLYSILLVLVIFHSF